MSRPHDGHRPFFPFGNPFKMILPRGSDLSPKLLGLLNSFEETLSHRFKNLKPNESSHVLGLSWMRDAMESLSETHTDVKSLITDLQFPVSDWDEQWMDMYLDNSVKLLDICIAFSSELSRLDQGQLFLQYVLHVLNPSSAPPSLDQLKQARGSLHDWMQQVNSRSPKFENCSSILQGLAGSLYLTKVKNSAKGKVLMRAMYGVKVQTIFICTVFTAAFSGSRNLPMDIHVSEKFLWAEAFKELQVDVYGEIRRLLSCGKIMALKELESVDQCVERLLSHVEGDSLQKSRFIGHEDPEELRALQECVQNLGESAERLAHGLDHLSKQVGDFFQIVLTGRDALLCNLRVPDVMQENNVDEYRL